MAHSGDNTSSSGRDYENMSRDELVAIVGGYVDADTSREDLIMMAMEAEDTEAM